MQICLRSLELVSGSMMVPQPCNQLRVATRTSLTLTDPCCACPRGAPRQDFENQHSKKTGVSSWGCGRARKVFSSFSLASAFQSCWAFLLFLSSPADAGDVFRGGHSQEVLFHYPRCCAFWAERGRSPHWDVPGPPAVPELKGPMFVNTTNS